MPSDRLKEFLEEQKVRFETITHSQAFTAQEIAAVAHVPGKELAKTVIVKLDGALAMAVVPGTDHLSMARLKKATGAREVELATEAEFVDRFPTCEVGAMPPFGNLWGLPVFVDQRLREDEHIAFNAGSHTELLKLPYAEFERLVRPVVAELSARA
ncbi:MAG TPA: YbaK/EbsC family protein [Longimicrobiales bacterium]|nr:YbaK/EbsC family protein [Longimicrobiales bacterium]